MTKPKDKRTNPLMVRGQKFPTQAAAAKHYQMSKSAITMAVKRGSLDRLAAPQLYERGQQVTKCPVVIRGVQYSSMTHAARVLKISHSVISRALDKGLIDNVGLGRGPKSHPCRCEGTDYPSKRSAYRATIKKHGFMLWGDFIKLLEFDNSNS